MITHKDAIKLGQQIVFPAVKCKDDPNEVARHSIRGTVIIIMDNLWYNVFDDRIKASFNYNKDLFYKESGWE